MKIRDVYSSSLPLLVDLVSNSVLIEEHRDRVKNSNGERFPTSVGDPHIEKIQRLFGCLRHNGVLYRAKTTIQVYVGTFEGSRHHGYEVTEIELLAPKAVRSPSEILQPLTNNSISLANLLQNVELSYESGVGVLEAMQACHHFVKTRDKSKILELYARTHSELPKSDIFLEAERSLSNVNRGEFPKEPVSPRLEKKKKGRKL